MRYVLLALIMLCCRLSSAQLNGKYIFKNINQADGLLHNTVLDIGQDEKGFMWIVTPNGLQRYDGHRFVNYPQVFDEPLEGSQNYAKLIIDTTHKKVNLVVTETIQSLDLINNKISSVTSKNLSRESTFIFETKDKVKNVISDIAFYQYYKDSLLTSYIFSDRERNTYLIRDLVSGDVFLPQPYDFGVARKGSPHVEFMRDAHPTHPLLLQLLQIEKELSDLKLVANKIYIRHGIMDSHRNLWIVTWNEILLRYDLTNQKIYYYDLQKIKESQISEGSGNPVILVNQIFEDRQHNLWVAMDNGGIARYDRQKNNFQFITSDSRMNNGLQFNFQVSAIYQDWDNNIWIGTDRGINIFNPYKNQIQIIRHEDGNPKSLPNNDILDFIETSEGEILVGSWGGGITVFDMEWHFLRQIEFDGGTHPNQVWSFVRNDDGTIWAGTQAGYIHIYDPVLRTFKTIRPPETGYNTIMYLRKDLDGNILLGLSGGTICVWNKSEKKFYPFNKAEDTIFASASLFNNLYVDNLNQCWASFNFGLMKFDQKKRIYTGMYFIPTQNGRGRNTFGMESYHDTLMLIGVSHAGLQLFNKQTFSFKPFLEKQLPEFTTVNAIKKDEEGNIWFTTQFQLYKINTKLETTRLDLGNSVGINAMGFPWFYELSDGRWVTSSWAELICFHPGDFSPDLTDLDIQFSSFKLFDKDIYIDSFISQRKPVILDHHQNFFSIEFANLHFHDVRTTNYFYRLSDVDPDWVRTETPLAEYTDIKPGEYIFEVKAEQGNVFSKVVSFSIIINPPWWATWWFRALCAIALITLIYFLIRKRIQIIRKEAGLQQLIAETKMIALRSQMNPHFIFNCLNSIDNLIQTDQKEKATTYLAKFAKLIRAILENSKNNVIPCWKDLEALELYLEMETLRWDNKISYRIQVDPEVKNGDYKIPPMVVQPFVENAIHHGLLNKKGNDKRLDIAVELEGEDIKYTITDNGVGREKAAEYKMLNRSSQLSYGIQITKDRIDLFNQNENQSIKITDLYNHENEPTGTMVEVWLTTQPQTI